MDIEAHQSLRLSTSLTRLDLRAIGGSMESLISSRTQFIYHLSWTDGECWHCLSSDSCWIGS